MPGWATLVVAVTFLSGLQMLFLGIIGQYLRAVFLETKSRPSYVVGDIAISRLSERRVEVPDGGSVAEQSAPPAWDAVPRAARRAG